MSGTTTTSTTEAEIAKDLERAWLTMQPDVAEVPQWKDAAVFRLLKNDQTRNAWINEIARQIDREEYVPQTTEIALVGKPNGGYRPRRLLSARDLLVYTYCGIRLAPVIREAIRDTEAVTDFGYILNEPAEGPRLFLGHRKCWPQFGRKATQLLRHPYSILITADVLGCYDNIRPSDIRRLLHKIGAPTKVIDLLHSLLTRWAILYDRKGIPQSTSTSHLLAKLLFAEVDRQLASLGYHHCRYVDDFRIVARSRNAAKKVVRSLQRVLATFGLRLNSKTQYLSGRKATRYLDAYEWGDIDPEDYAVGDIEPDPHHIDGGPYQMVATSSRKQDDLDWHRLYEVEMSSNLRKAPKAIVKRALEHLGEVGDPIAMADVKRHLREAPYYAENLLRYVEAIRGREAAAAFVDRVLRGRGRNAASRQYEILNWLGRSASGASDRFAMANACRRLIGSRNAPPYLRMKAISELGRHGAPSDMVRLARQYSSSDSEDRRVEVMYALSAWDKAARNAFLLQCSEDGVLEKAACRAIRGSAGQAVH